MPGVSVGDRAPHFRLPSGQGPEVGLADFAGRTVIVWFTKGMACPFCRQQMSQLARGYSAMKALGVEVLQVTTTKPERARFYARQFPLPFPYLCDADYQVRDQWGMERRSHGPGFYIRGLVAGMTAPKPDNDFGQFNPSPGELPNLLTDDDFGFFVVDGQGIVRHAATSSYVDSVQARSLPGNDEILRLLESFRGPKAPS